MQWKRALTLVAATAVLTGSNCAWAAGADKSDSDGGMAMKKIVQTAGRNALGEFAPEFAHYNDDVLFGENWNNEDIDLKTRSMITVVALMAAKESISVQELNGIEIWATGRNWHREPGSAIRRQSWW